MSKYEILNKIKSLALGLDELLKKEGQKSVRYHHGASAVYQSIYSLIISKDMQALERIFGDSINDAEDFTIMESVIRDYSQLFKKAGCDDQGLSHVYNDFRIIDQDSRFPTRFEPTAGKSQFYGKIIITNSFDRGAKVHVGDLVNVTLTIHKEDAENLVEAVRKDLESFGLIVSRLTGTKETDERHVSLALRIPATLELQAVVDKINESIESFEFATAGKLKVVIPSDIRTSVSAVELLDDASTQVLEGWQRDIQKASTKTGNRLPSLHITHGNCPVKPARKKEIMDLASITQLESILRTYELSLPSTQAETITKSGLFRDTKDTQVQDNATVRPGSGNRLGYTRSTE